jgi:hypothetical protein
MKSTVFLDVMPCSLIEVLEEEHTAFIFRPSKKLAGSRQQAEVNSGRYYQELLSLLEKCRNLKL